MGELRLQLTQSLPLLRRSLQIRYVDPASIPLSYVSSFVPQRHAANEYPAILAVRPSHSYLAFHEAPIFHGCAPVGDELVTIFGMNYRFPVPTQHVICA